MGREPPPLMEIKIDQTVPVRPNISPPTPYHAFVRWTSWLVPVIVAANCVVFLATMYVNDCPKNSGSCLLPSLGRFSFQPRSENVLIGPSSTTLDKMGALDATKVVHGHQGWRLLTCSWLHAGILHILANMVGLLCIGIRLEWDFGFVRIGLIYLISGFGGSLMSVFFLRSSISVGASGALFGLLGSMLSDLLINWTIYANKIVALLTLIFFITINLAIGFLPHVDNFAHFGGSISGFLLGFVLLIRPQFEWLSRNSAPGNHTGPVKPKHTMIQYILWTLSTILLIVGSLACLCFSGGFMLAVAALGAINRVVFPLQDRNVDCQTPARYFKLRNLLECDMRGNEFGILSFDVKACLSQQHIFPYVFLWRFFFLRRRRRTKSFLYISGFIHKAQDLLDPTIIECALGEHLEKSKLVIAKELAEVEELLHRKCLKEASEKKLEGFVQLLMSTKAVFTLQTS